MQATRDIHSHNDTARRGGRSVFSFAVSPLAVLLISASLLGLALSPVAAQVAAPAQQASAPSPDDIKQREQELEAAREQQKKAAELQAKLKADRRAHV